MYREVARDHRMYCVHDSAAIERRMLVLSLGLLLLAGLSPFVLGVPLYGTDDRKDLYEIRDPKIRQLARSTVALFPADQVQLEGSVAKLELQVYGEAYDLVREERFWRQPMGATCSGGLVGPDLVFTAGHCVRTPQKCKDRRFVFDFAVGKRGSLPDVVAAGSVYECKELLFSTSFGEIFYNGVVSPHLNHDDDVALVRLSRRVRDRRPLRLHRTGRVTEGTPLFIIGYPHGLPVKVAGNAKVRKVHPDGYLIANLDELTGNSGSPVFNAKTHEVVGILVRTNDVHFDLIDVLSGQRISLDPGDDGWWAFPDIGFKAAIHVYGQNEGDGSESTSMPRILSLLKAVPRPGFGIFDGRSRSGRK